MPTPSRPVIQILLVDDDIQLRQGLARRFQGRGWKVAEVDSGEEAVARAEQGRFDVALLDLNLPGLSGIEVLGRLKALQPELEAIMLTGHGSMETAITALKAGAYDYLTKPFQLSDLEIHLEKAYEKVCLARRERQWVGQLAYESPRYRLVGSSPSIRRVVQLIERVAPTDATVLVRGPSGTGKELVARALHLNSPRRERPLVTINCAALQETLLESELFGHERGAFTGAVQAKAGLVELAEGGTLFIDEIGEMAAGLQAKLLRVLEDGHYRRVGGAHEQHADVRVVAATNRPLEEEMKAGRFREDLYYRLNVITVTLPPLRERRQDIPELVEHFLTTRVVGTVRCQVQPQAMRALKSYDWPGNIRELANVLERAQILAEGHVITMDDLPDSIAGAGPQATEDNLEARDPRHLCEVERRHVVETLKQENGNKVSTAKVLGISRRALYRLLEKYSPSEVSHASAAEPGDSPSSEDGPDTE